MNDLTDVVMEHDEAIASRIEKQAERIKDGYDRLDAWAIVETYCGEVEMNSLLNQLSRIAVCWGEDKQTALDELDFVLKDILERAAIAQATKDVANNDDIEIDETELDEVA